VLISAAPRVYFHGILLQETGSTGGGAVVTDRLGSVRANTQSSQTMKYYPYGAEITSTGDGRGKFGSYWRDSVGVDYANQRYYLNTIGRFLTPDPGGMGTADPKLPASWNRYAYVNGDPINFNDPRRKERYVAGFRWQRSLLGDCGVR
jgi:RHS repeat-associated protein